MTPEYSPAEFIQLITAEFQKKATPERAEQQQAYMRHQFEFLGIGASEWYPMIKQIYKQHGMYSGKLLKEFVEGCYDQPYREIVYAGIEMMQRKLPEQNKSFIKVIEKCISTQSWWDTVDWLAKLAGMQFQQYPELQIQYVTKWIHSNNMWLQRAAILHQLFYRENTNEKLLFELIRQKADSNEFFIRKACGWALRQYSKTDPGAVKKFVAKQRLSPLTAKEALRLIKN